MVTVVTGPINIYPNPVSGMLNVAIGQSNDNPDAPAPEKVAAASPLLFVIYSNRCPNVSDSDDHANGCQIQ